MNKQNLLRPRSEPRGASLLRSPTEWLGTWLTMGTNPSRSALYVATIALGLVGMATPFLPFKYDVSPLGAAAQVVNPHSDFFWLFLVGSPFFLAILVSIASIRLMVLGKSTRSELAIAYCSSIIMACATLFLMIAQGISDWPFTLHDWLSLALPCATIALGCTLVVRSWRLRVPPGLIAVTAMQSAYVANALLCLLSYWPDWQIGAICTLLTVLAYVGQALLLVLRKEFRAQGLSGPRPISLGQDAHDE